jgi:D-glycero-D-manno-heptose 1,7-bisphosphate phosphatase
MTAPLIEALRPTVFLDRDGVINMDTGYPYKPSHLRFTPTAVEGIAQINRAGCFAIVVTNQSGVARGLFSLADVERFHDHLSGRLADAGAHINAFYVAPYLAGGTVEAFAIEHEDRKPGPGMLLRAMREWPIDPARSVLIGDKPSDAEAARRAGIASITVASDVCDLAATVAGWLRRCEIAPL